KHRSRRACRCASCSSSRLVPPPRTASPTATRCATARSARRPDPPSQFRNKAGLRMQFFPHDGFDLAFIDVKPAAGVAEPVLLVHGFASSHSVNWITPGWVKTLTEAGYRVIAFDNRGHGASSKSYDTADYTPEKMAGDAAALL